MAWHTTIMPTETRRLSAGSAWKAEGLHVRFEPNGMMTDSGWYSKRQLTGQRLRWYPNGYLHDSDGAGQRQYGSAGRMV